MASPFVQWLHGRPVPRQIAFLDQVERDVLGIDTCATTRVGRSALDAAERTLQRELASIAKVPAATPWGVGLPDPPPEWSATIASRSRSRVAHKRAHSEGPDALNTAYAYEGDDDSGDSEGFTGTGGAGRDDLNAARVGVDVGGLERSSDDDDDDGYDAHEEEASMTFDDDDDDLLVGHPVGDPPPTPTVATLTGTHAAPPLAAAGAGAPPAGSGPSPAIALARALLMGGAAQLPQWATGLFGGAAGAASTAAAAATAGAVAPVAVPWAASGGGVADSSVLSDVTMDEGDDDGAGGGGGGNDTDEGMTGPVSALPLHSGVGAAAAQGSGDSDAEQRPPPLVVGNDAPLADSDEALARSMMLGDELGALARRGSISEDDLAAIRAALADDHG